MSQNSKIEWTDATWNPIRARPREAKEEMGADGILRVIRPWGYHCEHISPGCANCYAETMNGRMLPAWGTGMKYNVPNRAKVEIFLNEEELLKPLRWRKPRKVFPCSMTDMFADFVPEWMIDNSVALMTLCFRHQFQCLTKRAERAASYFSDEDVIERIEAHMMDIIESQVDPLDRRSDDLRATAPDIEQRWPLPNALLGFSAENQQCFDSRWEHMRKLAAAGWKVWCSAEPLLSHINMEAALRDGLSWCVVGGESGHGARPMSIEWVRGIIRQCRDAEVPVFVKQMGAKPYETNIDVAIKNDAVVSIAAKSHPHLQGFTRITDSDGTYLRKNWRLKDKKGGDMAEWPEDLRVREVPR